MQAIVEVLLYLKVLRRRLIKLLQVHVDGVCVAIVPSCSIVGQCVVMCAGTAFNFLCAPTLQSSVKYLSRPCTGVKVGRFVVSAWSPSLSASFSPPPPGNLYCSPRYNSMSLVLFIIFLILPQIKPF